MAFFGSIEIELNNNFTSIVDDDIDPEILDHKWFVKKSRNKFYAYRTVGTKKKHTIGYFSIPEDAYEAYKNFCRKNRPNFNPFEIKRLRVDHLG